MQSCNRIPVDNLEMFVVTLVRQRGGQEGWQTHSGPLSRGQAGMAGLPQMLNLVGEKPRAGSSRTWVRQGAVEF